MLIWGILNGDATVRFWYGAFFGVVCMDGWWEWTTEWLRSSRVGFCKSVKGV